MTFSRKKSLSSLQVCKSFLGGWIQIYIFTLTCCIGTSTQTNKQIHNFSKYIEDQQVDEAWGLGALAVDYEIKGERQPELRLVQADQSHAGALPWT